MSLMGTLAKVAIGVVVAKGVSGMMQGGRSRRESPGGGLGDMMGDILGGAGSSGRSSAKTGGIGDLLEELGQYAPDRARDTARGTGLDDILGRTAGSGGLGDILGGVLGSMMGGASPRAEPHAAPEPEGGFGELLNESIGQCGEPTRKPTPQQDAAAGLMLRAMIQAARADGRIDAHEERKLAESLADATPEERRFVEEELRRPIDARALAEQVPPGLEPQVYAMSVMAIDLDSRAEATYLHELAQALGFRPEQVNAIHDRLGVPPLYR